MSGSSSTVEHHVANVGVASSNLVYHTQLIPSLAPGRISRMTNKSSVRAVLVFAAISLPQPWPCFFCGGPVEIKFKAAGRGGDRDTMLLHHIDGDHDNDDPSNWAAAHQGCHTKHHFKGRAKNPVGVERHRQAIRANFAAMTDEERKEKTANAGKASHSPEANAKRSATLKKYHEEKAMRA
jgi:hypothetical protein